GLAAFDEADEERFFGRETEVAELLARLRRGDRLVTLLGASGAGKSSLLLAGLLPVLRREGIAGKAVRIVRLRPGPRPVHELALRLLERGEGRAESLDGLKRLREDLLADPDTLSDYADLGATAGGSDPASLVVLAVDQFEEVFTQAEAEQRDPFLANLLHAVTVAGGRVIVIATLRADFLGRALGHSHALATAIKESQEVVLPLAPEQL
ncbi:MAG: peptidase C14, partial [bacterium]|nr:peptidase C14 [bacterium]